MKTAPISCTLAFLINLRICLVQCISSDSSATYSDITSRLASNTVLPNAPLPAISQSFNMPVKFPNFIRPSVNPTTGCNLWGLLCQTDLVEVAVNMTTTITTTTVPCSYYLSAQAQSVPTAWVWEADGKSRTNADFLSSFGRSPECSGYANYLKAQSSNAKPIWFHSAHGHLNEQIPSRESLDSKKALITEDGTLKSAFHFSKCGSNIQSDLRSYVPPGVSNRHIGGPETDFYCCGSCTLRIGEIKLLYFPPASSDGCSQNLLNTTSQKENRGHYTANSVSILVTEGHTFTSPSFYLSLVGTASAQDSCGQVGSVHTNAVISVPIGGLSTISLDVPIGASFLNRAEYRGVNHDSNWTDFSSYTKQVRVEDLACPTWGLMKPEDKNGYATVGLPFFPIIHPPSEISAIDRAWGRCSDFATLEREGNYRAYEIFDPPRVLVPVSALAPATNPVTIVTSLDPSSTVISLPEANPVDTRSPELPSSTAKSLSSNIVKSYKEKPEQPSSGISKPASTGNLENLDPNESIYRSTHKSPTELKKDASDPGMTRKSVESYSPEAKSGMNVDYFIALKGLGIPNTSLVGESKPSRLDADEDGLLTFPRQDFTARLSNDVLAGVTIKPDETKNMGLKTLISMEAGGKLLIDSSTAKPANFLPSPVPSTHTGEVSSGNLLFLSIDGGTVSSNRPRTSMSAKPFTLEPTGTLSSRTGQTSLPSGEKFRGGQGKMQAPKKQIICLGLVMGGTFFWL